MAPSFNNTLIDLYNALLHRFGPQHWWPGDSPFEIMVGAVLTQNTNWTNVEKAIANLKNANCLTPHAIHNLTHEQLAPLIKPAGYFNLKARRLKNLINWLIQTCDGDLSVLQNYSTSRLREELLSINGIGQETADSIILYAFEKLTFVVDTYTFRVLVRHGRIDADSHYEQIKDYCESNLPDDLSLYNEFHALIVRVGKDHCKPRAKCANCPLEPFEHSLEEPY